MKTFAIAAALFISGCASISEERGAAAIPPGSVYVSMGSSFAAGAGIGPNKPGTLPRCQQSVNNYASLLAQRLRLELVDVSCGGAKTSHILGPWDELPAQIDALTSNTRLVTITIGGNDLGYAGGLLGGSCRAGAPFRPGPCLPAANPIEEDYRKLEINLRKIARQVASRAPAAKLVFVQYVSLVPPVLCATTAIPPEEADVSRAIGRRLAEVTARVARETGALLLGADELSRDHTACSAQPWSNGMAPGFDRTQGAPWHPNAAGHAALAQALADLLQS